MALTTETQPVVSSAGWCVAFTHAVEITVQSLGSARKILDAASPAPSDLIAPPGGCTLPALFWAPPGRVATAVGDPRVFIFSASPGPGNVLAWTVFAAITPQPSPALLRVLHL
jgi:hypothetical protein